MKECIVVILYIKKHMLCTVRDLEQQDEEERPEDILPNTEEVVTPDRSFAKKIHRNSKETKKDSIVVWYENSLPLETVADRVEASLPGHDQDPTDHLHSSE